MRVSKTSGRKMNNSFFITVSNGLLKNGHRKRMGEAVWEFMWLLDKITKIQGEIGYVLGGKPIKLEEISETMGVHFNTVSRNLSKLNELGYIKTLRTPHGMVIRVMKAKKRFNKKLPEDATDEEYFEWQREKMSFDRKGENHYNWKGGITPENHVARNSIEYKAWRSDVFERDKFTCVICSKKGGRLEAHHLKGFAENVERRYVKENGITLCINCHKAVHKVLRNTENSESLRKVNDYTEMVNLLTKMVNVIKTTTGDITDRQLATEVADSPDIVSIIKAFQDFNPVAKRWYGNKTQRGACERLIEAYGLEKTLRVISFLPKSNRVRYLPKIYSPLQLEEKWLSLEDGLIKEKDKQLSKGRGLA